MLNGADHLAVGPPHEDRRCAGAIDRGAQHDHVGSHVGARAREVDNRTVGERHRHLRMVPGGGRPARASGQRVFDDAGRSHHGHLDADDGHRSPGLLQDQPALVIHWNVGRSRAEQAAPIRADLQHRHAVATRRLPDGLHLRFAHRPHLAVCQPQNPARSPSGPSPHCFIELATHRPSERNRALRPCHDDLDALLLGLSYGRPRRQAHETTHDKGYDYSERSMRASYACHGHSAFRTADEAVIATWRRSASD